MTIGLALLALLVGSLVWVVFFALQSQQQVAKQIATQEMSDFDRALIKKYPEADVHKNRAVTLAAGLAISLLIIWTILEHNSVEKEAPVVVVDESTVVEEVQMIEIPPTVQPPPPKPKISQVIVEVEDEEIIEEEEIIIEEDPIVEEELDMSLVEEEEEEEEEEEPEPPKIFFNADISAEPLNGMGAFNASLMNELANAIPAKVNINDVPAGVVMLQFIVLENGSLANLQVVQGVDPQVDQIVKNSFYKLGKWKAGSIQGQNIRQQMMYPVAIAFD